MLPLDVADGISADDLKSKPIFDLLDASPETEILRVTYTMTASLISLREAEVMSIPPETPVLVRTGVYYNRAERPLMIGRVTFLAERVELRFEFHKADENWGVVTVV